MQPILHITNGESAAELIRRSGLAGEALAWDELSGVDFRLVPFLPAPMRRLLEELPAAANSLGRTDQQTLGVLRRPSQSLGQLFRSNQDLEEAPFSGDLVYFDRIAEMAREPRPLLAFEDGPAGPESMVRLTPEGAAVARGELDAIALRGCDRWLGGTHLVASPSSSPSAELASSARPIWRWDGERPVLV